MNFTDITFIVIILVLTVTGYARGFLRTIIGPAAFIIATAAAYFYFKQTNNVLVALGIGIFGPIFLGWLINLTIDNTILRNKVPTSSPVSRTFGAIFNLIWGGLIFLSVFAFLILIPLKPFGLGDINANVRSSMTHKLLKGHFEKFGIISPDEGKECATGVCSMLEEDKKSLAEDKDVQDIMNDPRVQKLMADPAMQAAIAKQDFAAILANPLVFELGQDPAFIGKAMRVYPKVKAASQP
jgi:uncharacterized membrane protein required for colicin V production